MLMVQKQPAVNFIIHIYINFQAVNAMFNLYLLNLSLAVMYVSLSPRSVMSFRCMVRVDNSSTASDSSGPGVKGLMTSFRDRFIPFYL